jgi:hypothetical protein
MPLEECLSSQRPRAILLGQTWRFHSSRGVPVGASSATVTALPLFGRAPFSLHIVYHIGGPGAGFSFAGVVRIQGGNLNLDSCDYILNADHDVRVLAGRDDKVPWHVQLENTRLQASRSGTEL